MFVEFTLPEMFSPKSMARFFPLASSTLFLLLSPTTTRAFLSPVRPVSSSHGAARSETCAKPWKMVADGDIRVFLVRHGAVDLTTPEHFYPKGAFYGGDDVPLSKLGEREAQAAGAMLKDEAIDLIVSSPLRRAVYGAKQVGGPHNLEPILDDRFREIERGRWLGLTKEQVEEKYPGDLASYAADPTWKEHGGETYTDLFERVMDGFADVLKTAREQKKSRVALVSHMWVTKSIVTHSMGLVPAQVEEWKKVDIPTASISVLDFPREGGTKGRIVEVGVKPALGAEEAAEAAAGNKWGG